MKELIAALIKAKGEFRPVVKDRKGARSTYATLDSVYSAIDKALLDNGLVLMQPMTFAEGRHVLKTVIWHVSGQCLESDYYPIVDNSDPQKVGAAITYARRYQLCAMLGITADEDSDAEGFSSAPQGGKPQAVPNKPDFPSQAKEQIQIGIENGLTVDAIRDACKAEGLPDSSGRYKTAAQITALGALIQDLISAKETAA